MSNNERGAPMVVGVDGSEDSLRALDWAAAEAARHGWPLRIVSAYEANVAALPAVAVTLPGPTERVKAVLAQARDRVANAYPELAVSTEPVQGPAPHVLLTESERARMLVVGREGVNRLAEIVLGSVSLECATHAQVPVAVIPAAWDPPKEPYGRIVLGIDGSENCQAATQYAFEEATERDAELIVAYAWHQPTHRPDDWPARTDDPHVRADFHQVLADFVSAWRDKYPDARVTAIDEVNHPALVLGHLSADADMVVIGGRGHGTVTGALLGSVAKAILRHVDRPVVVVHEPKQ
ncbi:MAG: universal stress protein [Actinomycetota bacterium]